MVGLGAGVKISGENIDQPSKILLELTSASHTADWSLTSSSQLQPVLRWTVPGDREDAIEC